MRNRMPALLTAVFLAVAVWGGYHEIKGDLCRPAAGAPCPPTPGIYPAAWGLGLAALVVLLFAGARTLAFCGVFAGIGLPIVLAGLTGDGEPWFVPMGLGFTLVIPLLFVVLAVVESRSAKAKLRLLEHGVEGVGTVLTVADTNVTINNNPRLSIRLRIEPYDASIPPYELEKAATVPRIAIPRPGDRYPVWIDPDDHSKLVFTATVPEAGAHPRMRSLWARVRQGVQPTVPAAAAPAPDVLAELHALTERHRRGEVDDASFAARTAELLEANRPAR